MCNTFVRAVEIYRVDSGLATFGPAGLAIREALEARILSWAEEIGAAAMGFPPLMRSSDLSRFDYFRNFPHLAVVASRIRGEVLDGEYGGEGGDVTEVPSDHLEAGRWVLPSAACYNVYLHLEGSTLDEPAYFTTVATCFRNENAYDELQRLWSFHMREIVCVASSDEVQSYLGDFKKRLEAFTRELDLPIETKWATDPFYQPQSSTARMQKLFPQKEELVYDGSLAIGSLNFHRNFFGERCNIRLANGEPAFTGCVAFGLERWIWTLLERHGHDASAVLRALGVSG